LYFKLNTKQSIRVFGLKALLRLITLLPQVVVVVVRFTQEMGVVRVGF